MRPVYLEWETFSVCAIPGNSGSGKTSSLRFFMAQFALDKIGLIICDPHGNLSRSNLAATTKSLNNAIIRKIAIEKKDILNTIRYVKDIMTDRYNRGAENEQRIVLIIDEVVSFLLDCTPQEITEIAAFLLKLANEARKVGIRVFLSSQSWRADYVGSKSVRNAINAIIFHRISEEEAKLFFPSMPAQLRRKISGLKQGKMIIKSAEYNFVEVTAPYITMDDLQSIQEFVPLVEPVRIIGGIQRMNNVELDGINDEESPKNTESAYMNSIQRAKTLTEATEMIKLSIELGIGKNQAIYQIFGVAAGGSKKFKSASKMYENVKKIYGL